MSLPMSVTIKDIAREAGVSYASVSRALSGSRGVSVKTAQRILAVAKKLNYLPNGIARNLVNQRSKTLGLILPDISNPFFSDIALAVIHTAERAGYQTILSNTDWEPRAQERQLQLHARAAGGWDHPKAGARIQWMAQLMKTLACPLCCCITAAQR